MAKPDDGLFEVLKEAGLNYNDIFLLNPVSQEVCVMDDRFLTGMPQEYNGKPITYVHMPAEERQQITNFRNAMNADHERRRLGEKKG